MSSSTAVTPETPITLKVHYLGLTKKLKLPLRDLIASKFEDKLRSALGVPPLVECIFERYSDSAGSFVVLDRFNESVYKQLYRAAKAKQKLKIRTVLPNIIHADGSSSSNNSSNTSLNKTTGPRPVTLEDVPDTTDSAQSTESAESAKSVDSASTIAIPVMTAIASATAAATADATSTTASVSTTTTPPPLPPKIARLTTTPVIVSSNMGRTDDDRTQCPALPGRFPIAAPSLDDFTWKTGIEEDLELHASLQRFASNHESLKRDIAFLGASIAKMGLQAGSSSSAESDSSAVSPTPAAAPAPSSVPASEKPEEPKIVPKKSAVTVTSSASAPQPIPVVKCTPRESVPAYMPYYDSLAKLSPPSSSPKEKESVPSDERPTGAAISALRNGFSLCCNSCDRTIPDTHFHCSTCDEGDFDLCRSCVDLGVTCYNPDHWLIKRHIKDGNIYNSTTERVPAKPKVPEPVSTPASAEPSVGAKEVPEPAKVTKSEQKPSTGRLGSEAVAEAPHWPRPQLLSKPSLSQVVRAPPVPQIRTCNNCICERPEKDFLHCTTCYDFDLCTECFVKNDHGHHPQHAFIPAVDGTRFTRSVTARLGPGRGQRHHAVCDGCDSFIVGVRHKCLDCPDWDYCSDCIPNADFIHAGHRFVPIYDPLPEATKVSRPVVNGIFCDGPHCANGLNSGPIIGDRYKCTVCNDTDFCAKCEASPANNHNKTHPLIKFKTPVRRVVVTTMSEHQDGSRMMMGDRRPSSRLFNPGQVEPRPSTPQESRCSLVYSPQAMGSSCTVHGTQPCRLWYRAMARNLAASARNFAGATAAAPPQGRAPLMDELKAQPCTLQADPEVNDEPSVDLLGATFEHETVTDGTPVLPNHIFEQTWVLRNTGSVAWPAGCCVRFVSGDYMGHVDPDHPAGIHELISASESTICYEALAPGETHAFTVLLRSPTRVGSAISYWRLTSKAGLRFGDRLWCDITVKPKEEAKEEPKVVAKENKEDAEEAKEEVKAVDEEVKNVKEEVKEEVREEVKGIKKDEDAQLPVTVDEEETKTSQMIFPKLDKESPLASVHEQEEPMETIDLSKPVEQHDLEEWADDSDDGFMTDEEYDILDASDEEILDEQATSWKK